MGRNNRRAKKWTRRERPLLLLICISMYHKKKLEWRWRESVVVVLHQGMTIREKYYAMHSYFCGTPTHYDVSFVRDPMVYVVQRRKRGVFCCDDGQGEKTAKFHVSSILQKIGKILMQMRPNQNRRFNVIMGGCGNSQKEKQMPIQWYPEICSWLRSRQTYIILGCNSWITEKNCPLDDRSIRLTNLPDSCVFVTWSFHSSITNGTFFIVSTENLTINGLG